jgi:hypothetical protein
LVNKTTDIEEDKVNRLSEGIPTITAEKAMSLGKTINEKIKQIVAEYQNNS